MATARVEPRVASWLGSTARTDLLRFSTAGSVDDGKSTLIGRLLFDSKGVYEDQLASVRKATRNTTTNGLDLSLLTDGLRAEREQGITIDVAYRYFATPKRKFIIADTPGHEQYTRNMTTGASTADLAIILVDARRGVLPQSRRHAFIASMLGIRHLVVAVNKMDLVGYCEEVFNEIRAEFSDYAARLQVSDLHFIPLSALNGDNVVEKSRRMPWFEDSSLLNYLENVHIASDRNLTELRFPVQYIIRPDLDFRGYAGQVASGVIKRGDSVVVLPSHRTTRVRSILTYDGELTHAFSPMSVVVCLEDEIDISRGDMLVQPSHAPHVTRRVDARIVWMHDHQLQIGRKYLLKHTTQTVQAAVDVIRYRLDVNTLEKHPGEGLGLNDIGAVVIETQKPIFCDPYRRNRMTGSFILIDPITNATVAAGMITGREAEKISIPETGSERFSGFGHRITASEQQSRVGHRVATVWLETIPEIVYEVERRLFDANCRVHAVAGEAEAVAEVCCALNKAGVIALVCGPMESGQRERTQQLVSDRAFVHVPARDLGETAETAADRIYRLLEAEGFLPGVG